MKPLPKRLFICCDGTTNDAIRNKNESITNVARFARCLKPYGSDGKLQLVYYHEGIGTLDGSTQYWDAGTGRSIHGDIQDAYHFLCLNYREDDEIHLIGFSRGAITARILACFINEFGVLRATRLALLTYTYDLWKDRKTDELEERAKKWKEQGHLARDVRIETCAVWDTVRAISLPSDTLAFVEDQVPDTLQNAFQALALHETRLSFKPVLWNTSLGGNTIIRQTWFAGDHSDIGGGHPDSGLATITLLWMISQFTEFTNVAFEEVMVLDFMTPLYLNKEEGRFYFQDHIYTLGLIHGRPDWKFEYPYSSKARKDFLKPAELGEVGPPEPSNRAQRPKQQKLDTSALVENPTLTPSFQYTGNIASPPGPKAWTTVHYTVRILVKRRDEKCVLLEPCEIRLKPKLVAWVLNHHSWLWEDRPTMWENWMYRQWIKREDEAFQAFEEKYASEGVSTAERFTAFLYKYRNDPVMEKAGPRRVSSDQQLRVKDESLDETEKMLAKVETTGAYPRRPRVRRSGAKVDDTVDGLIRSERDSIVTSAGVTMGARKASIDSAAFSAISDADSDNSGITCHLTLVPPDGQPPINRTVINPYRIIYPNPKPFIRKQIAHGQLRGSRAIGPSYNGPTKSSGSKATPAQMAQLKDVLEQLDLKALPPKRQYDIHRPGFGGDKRYRDN